MNYTYSQPQYQNPQAPAFNNFRQAPQMMTQWPQGGVAPQVRLVSSIEEVKACPIDFDGTIFYFSDVANKKIYTKQINLDGTVSINLYEQKEIGATSSQSISEDLYITRQEFDIAMNQMKELYEKMIKEINDNKQIPQPQQQPQQTLTNQFTF